MADNGFGEYRPQQTPSRCSDCGLCREVCPFDGGSHNELASGLFGRLSGVRSTPETGFYLCAYMGGVCPDSLRYTRTSGGLATWVLARLMETGAVDRVITVASGPDPERLFDFAEFDSVTSLWNAARSSYYPVEISSGLRAVLRSDRRYAVIGLPCLVKGIRLAQRRAPRLMERIPVVLGLVCGQQRGKFFAEYLVRRAGLTGDRVRRISFREKRETQPATLSHFAVWSDGEQPPRFVERSEGYGRAWGQSWFKQDACNYCDDVFAELADAAFMDAWLPVVQEDPRGTSIVLVRNPLCRKLLEDGIRSGGLQLQAIEIGEVVRSQQGCLRLKREGTALQLSWAGNTALEFQPRVGPAPKWRFVARFRKAAETRRMVASRAAMAAQVAAGPGLAVFYSELRKATRYDDLALSFLGLLSLPQRAVRKLFRIIREVIRGLMKAKNQPESPCPVPGKS